MEGHELLYGSSNKLLFAFKMLRSQHTHAGYDYYKAYEGL